MLLPNYFNVEDTVNKPYFKKRWSVHLNEVVLDEKLCGKTGSFIH